MMGEVGVREINGPRHNPRITEYFQTVILDAALKNDDSGWCAAIMNWSLPIQHRTKSALARSFMTCGEEIYRSDHGENKFTNYGVFQEGDICVFFDKTSTYKGHVGNFIAFNKKGNKVLVLGGNQADSVCYQWFPIDGKKLYLRSIRRI